MESQIWYPLVNSWNWFVVSKMKLFLFLLLFKIKNKYECFSFNKAYVILSGQYLYFENFEIQSTIVKLVRQTRELHSVAEHI
jgi:hypothetical protein